MKRDYGVRSGAFQRNQDASEAYWREAYAGHSKQAAHPAPLVAAECVDPPFGHVGVPAAARTLLRRAETAGWEVLCHYAKGTNLNAKGETAVDRVIHRKDRDIQVSAIKESVVVRLRHKNDYTETWVYAVAVWMGGKFESAYRTPQNPGETARMSADELKEFVCQAESWTSGSDRS